MTAEPLPAVTITIVLHNSADGLESCLRAIAPAVGDGFAEVIAVDNASPDGSAAILARELPHARILASAENLGFARGVNLAWPHVRGRYWVLLNPDVVVPSDGLRALAEWMDRHPRLGIASPEIAQADGTPSSAGRALPSIGRTLVEMTRLHRLLPRRARGRLLRGAYWTGGDQLDTGWVAGTAMVVRRAAVEPTGLADGIFMYGEDLEWCWRARRAGWRIGVCSAVTVVHAEATSARRTWGPEEALRRMARGMYEAVRLMRGSLYAGLYMRAEALALRVESVVPGRPPERRDRARALSRAWREAPRGGIRIRSD
jgi:GT2 family glycosyltransferase